MKSRILTVLLFICAMVPGNRAPAATLVHQWKFEGNVTDTSGGVNNGTITGSPVYTAGRFGQGLYLNRLDSVQKTAATGLPLLGSDSWSCNMWLYLTNTPESLAYLGGFGSVAGSGTGIARGLLAYGAPANQGVYSWGAGRDLASGQAYPLNQWIMVTVTHDGATGTRKLWLTGTNIATGIQALATAPATISVGALGPFAGRFQGIIDEFTIWQGVLTSNDLASLIASNSLPSLPPTILTPPQSVAAYAGEYTSMTVVPGGTGPFTFQWLKAGNAISGATNSTYGIYPLTAGDAADYTVVVNNLFGAVTSSPPASVTVLTVTNIATALAGYWKFDETTGLATADSTGNGNDGTLFNFTGDDSQWVPGKIGGSLKFRGPGAGLKDYVQVLNQNIHPPTSMTISAWVWADAISAWATIVKNWPNGSGNAQIHLGMNSTDGDLSNYVWTPGGQVGPVREGLGTLLPLGQWVHVALVCNGQTMQLFRNGAAIGTPFAYGGRINTNTLPNVLGIGVKLLNSGLPDADNGAPGYWKGKIDDLGMWTRGLSRAEILSIYLAGQAGQPLTNADSYSVTLPYITGQPLGVAKYAGEFKAQFNVQAVGGGVLHYQWQANGTDVPGATNNTLNLAGPFTNTAGYTVIVTDAGNGLSITSAPAALTVRSVASIATALAGYWNFDETTGTSAADSTTNARTATLYNYPDDSMWVPGKIGGALSFGGDLSGEYATVANFVQTTNNTLTVSAWVWADSLPTLASIVDNLGETSIGQLRFGVGGAATQPLTGSILSQAAGVVTATETTGLPNGSWQHVALVADGASLRLYRNGNLAASNAYNGTIVSPSQIQNLFIGARIADDGGSFNNPPGFWSGKMDDLGMWTRGLTADEVQAIFAAGYGGRPLTTAVVGAVKPIVTTPPAGQTVTEGADADFSVVATGAAPFTYQWYKNGTAIAGATNTTYLLPSTLLSDAADYTVVVGNILGSVTSAPPAALVITPLSRPLPAMTNQLVDYWKLDDASGTNALDSAGANNGSLFNFLGDSGQWVSGRVGGALQFGGPGPNNLVYIPDYTKSDTTMTVAAWVYADALPTWATILKNWGEVLGQFHFGLYNTVGNLSIYIQQANGATVSAIETATLPTNSWQHVAFTCDGANVNLYRNGVQVASAPYDGTLQSFPLMACLGLGSKLLNDCSGAPSSNAPGFWQGRLDDIGLWTRSLEALEVQSLYISGLGGLGIDSASLSPPLQVESAGGNVTFSWPATAQGRGFVLESSPSLPAVSWTPVAAPMTVTDGLCQVTVSAPAGGGGFFRLRQ